MQKVHSEWEATTELTVETLRCAMDVSATRGLWVLEVGHELAGTAGLVLAEAELAWPRQQVAVLHGEQTVGTAAFEHAGWRVYSTGEDGMTWRSGSWTGLLASGLLGRQ